MKKLILLIIALLAALPVHAQQFSQDQVLPISQIGGGIVVSTSSSADTLLTQSTSTLKLLSSDVIEGLTNLFYTATRANNTISASTTVAHATPVNGNVLLGNGTNWLSVATSSLGITGVTDHTALSNLAWGSSGHTGTAFNLAGFTSAGAATNYATSSLKILSSDVIEGLSNLFYTDTRVNTAISASTTVAHATPTSGNVLLGDGTNWTSVGTSSLGVHNPVTLSGENYLSLSNQVITANAITLSGSNVTGVLPSAKVGTSTLNINHNALGNLSWAVAGHTGTAFNVAGFDSGGAATNYATSTLKINHTDLGNLAWSASGHTGTNFNLAGFTSAGAATNYATSSLKINHTDLGNLAFTASGHTGTAFRLFGTDTSGAAAEYATSSLKLNLTNAVTDILPIANGGTNNASAYTAGSIPFSNGTSLTQNNANLFWDNTNNRLGVGSTSPNAALSVRGSGTGLVFQVASSSDQNILSAYPSGRVVFGTSTASFNPDQALVNIYGNTGSPPTLYVTGDAAAGFAAERQGFAWIRLSAGGGADMFFKNGKNFNIYEAEATEYATSTAFTGSAPRLTISSGGTVSVARTGTGLFGIGKVPATGENLGVQALSGTTTIQALAVTAGLGGRLILEDTDGLGCTEITTLNGVLTAKIVTCL